MSRRLCISFTPSKVADESPGIRIDFRRKFTEAVESPGIPDLYRPGSAVTCGSRIERG